MVILTAALWLWLPLAAQAAVVTAATANCRAAARSTAPVLARLTRGTVVPILSRVGSWRYVDPADAPACWIAAQLLAENVGRGHVEPSRTAAARPALNQPAPRAAASHRLTRHRGLLSPAMTLRSHKIRSLGVRPHSATRHRTRRTGGYGSGSSCPCNGRAICIGPRGGRYCITSGGNKRYGV